MKNIDSYSHVRGESLYVDDIPLVEGTLYGVPFASEISKGKIVNVDYSDALKMKGVFAIITSKDIPGFNKIGSIFQDEVLIVEDDITFNGQVIAIIIANSELIARNARKKIKLRVQEERPILDPREAFKSKSLIFSPRTFLLGDIKKGFDRCDIILEGKADSNGQEHLYLETQGAYAIPTEKGGLKIFSSTQGPTLTQQTTAKILGISMHKIEVDVFRIGGGFGGKEDQASNWGALAGVCAYLLKKPVKLVLNRQDDLKMTGKRHPYSSDYKIGLTKDGKILAYEVTFYQNAGATADLSPAILERTLFHTTNSYFIPNVKATAISCKTNLPSNTAFRGFGGPQAMFVVEAAISHAAETLGIDALEIQRKNLLKEGDEFPYGQIADNCQAKPSWLKAEELYDKENLIKAINEFNSKNHYIKKGLAFMPICFGISFTKINKNKAGSLVHIYEDGSISVSTGAVEMGQGVNTRILQVPSQIFSIDASKVKIETTNTTRVANTSPTAASSSADLNGKATEEACNILLGRLLTVACKKLSIDNKNRLLLKNEVLYLDNKTTDITWKQLVNLALDDRIDLTAHGYYATPVIYFDKKREKGHPFAYHVYGTSIIVVTVDCLRGIYEIDGVYVVHDYGQSMNSIIDIGQTEGGIVQGIGWMTSEEVLYDDQGKLLSNALSTYKIPDIYAIPKEIKVHFLDDSVNPLGLFKSKAIGEPPLMYGIGAYFAIRNAIKAFNPASTISFNSPITPEKVLFGLYGYPRDKESSKDVNKKILIEE